MVLHLWYEFRNSCLSLSVLIKSVGQLKFPGSSELCFVNCMCLRPLMHDLNCFVNVNRWKSIGSRVDFSKSSKMCMPCINHAALSRPLLFFYTCLTGGLRYCQKQDISVCMSRSNWPMKPFIKKTFAPESVSSDLKWAHLMNVEWFSNSIFSFLIFFKTHIRLHRIY